MTANTRSAPSVRYRCLINACLVALICSTTAAADDSKPIDLFDGKSFRGWEGDVKSTWRIEDGALVAGSHEKPAPRNEFLTTTRQFQNFDLRLEFRVEGDRRVNAGVQLRTRRIPDHHEVIGYQADIGDGVYGNLYDESRRRRNLAEADPEVVERALQAIGDDGWHEYRICAVGPRIQLWLNGVQTIDYTEPQGDIPRTGVIAVQIHGGMQAIVRYRDIRIVELPGAVSPNRP